jgi:hypothetical protein
MFAQGERGNASGAAIFANPFGLLPADGIRMSYEVFFPDTWDWVIAGKLPGVSLGTAAGQHASGGQWKDDAGSFRVMWQKPVGTTALIKGYAYLALPGGVARGMDPQGPNARAAMEDDDRTGYSVWYRKNPGMTATKGQWNAIDFTVKLNTPGRADGVLSMTVNGVTRSINDMVWRSSVKVRIVDMYFVSIFGGNDKKFAVKYPTHALFRNVRFETL